MSGILETIASNQTRIISLLEVLVGANGTAAAIPAAVVEAAAGVNTPAKELTPGEDVGVVTDATELDIKGMPWDSRIHAKTKTKNKDHTWKYAVGIDRDVLVPQVEAELRAAGYGQTAAATPAATPGVPPVAETPTAPAAPAIPAIPSVPVTPAAKVEFPVIANAEAVTDAELTQTAAALMDKHGVDVLTRLLTLFTVPEGGNVLQVPASHKYAFFQYASTDDHLRSQSLI